MKLIKLFLCLSFVLFSFPANAETWAFLYLMEKQKYCLGSGRQGFYNVTSKGSKIIFEDNRIISLHNTYSPTYADYFATLLDKKKYVCYGFIGNRKTQKLLKEHVKYIND